MNATVLLLEGTKNKQEIDTSQIIVLLRLLRTDTNAKKAKKRYPFERKI